MVDLAIGVVIGAAFGALVQSIVNDIIMPVVGYITGGIDFSQMFVQLKGTPQATLADARKVGATIAYGNFITLVINFLIVAAVLFFVVKVMNRLKRQPPPATPEPVKLSRQEELLVQIRDLLQARG